MASFKASRETPSSIEQLNIIANGLRDISIVSLIPFTGILSCPGDLQRCLLILLKTKGGTVDNKLAGKYCKWLSAGLLRILPANYCYRSNATHQILQTNEDRKVRGTTLTLGNSCIDWVRVCSSFIYFNRLLCKER